MSDVKPDVREALADLKARYFFYIDTQQWGRLREVFHADARFEGYAFPGEGPDAFVAAVEAQLDGARSIHHAVLPRFEGRAEGIVRARWSMQDYVTWPPGSRSYFDANSPDLYGYRGYGYYEEEYSLRDGEWRISFMRLARLRTDLLRGAVPLEPHGALTPSPEWIP